MNPKTLLAAVLLVWGPALRGAVPITIGETVRIPSRILAEERTLLISLPDASRRGTPRYPVLYLTDADAQFMHTRGTVDFLARNGLMPNMIIVGVTNTDRARDLTPTRADWTDRDGKVTKFPTSGGADRFLDFFEKELIPYVEANYRTEPYRVLCGHSFGGLFAVHAFLSRPELFNAVISVSPTLFWDGELELKKAAAFLAGRKFLKRTFFVTMGTEGEQMQTAFDRFAKTLSSNVVEGFRWGSMKYADEDHGTVVLRSHYDGLKRIFEGWRLPRDIPSGDYHASLEETVRHFQEVSDRLGWKVLPPEALVNQMGYQALGKKDTARALEFFRYNAATYPDSANVYDSLGDALEADGQLEAAWQSFTKAAETGEKNGDPDARVYRKNADRLREKLGKSP